MAFGILESPDELAKAVQRRLNDPLAPRLRRGYVCTGTFIAVVVRSRAFKIGLPKRDDVGTILETSPLQIPNYSRNMGNFLLNIHNNCHFDHPP